MTTIIITVVVCVKVPEEKLQGSQRYESQSSGLVTSLMQFSSVHVIVLLVMVCRDLSPVQEYSPLGHM